MKDLWTVASYTIKDMFKKKTFLISNLIILIMIVVGFNIPNVLSSFDNEEGEGGGSGITKELVVDSKNIYEGTLNSLNSLDLGYEFIIENKEVSFEEIKEKIENDEIEDAIIIDKINDKIQMTYIVEDATMMTEVPESLRNTFTNLYTNLQLTKLNLSEEQLASLSPEFEFSFKQTAEQEVKGNVFAIMLLSLVLFYAIYFCAYQVSASITTEKTSKIMETLVTSTKPRTIVLGKTIGIGIVGFVQVIIIVTVALICAKYCLPEGVLEAVLDMSQITPTLGIFTILYFILGYATFALLYALTGSTVSKPEDVQTANGPVAIVAVVGFYLSYFTMMNPTSDLNVFASIFPFSSPFCMPFRIMMGIATPSQIAISFAVLVVTILIIANISIKIYSNAILNYGSRVTLKDMIKMYKSKDDNNS
ncbi:MAG: ABC transporter permease [Clostridia bacterium]|nr:ABC transporter permease [Clostridia bacterium]